MRKRRLSLVLLAGLTACSASHGAPPAAGATHPVAIAPTARSSELKPTVSTQRATLAAEYARYFDIGAAVDAESYVTHAALLTTHFNSITAENAMKFESLQPTEGNFAYDTADGIVAFAEDNGMRMHGHALVWHRQTPSWVFTDATGADVSPQVLLARLRAHIDNVVGHFKGKVRSWDVVNEAIRETGAYRTGSEESSDQNSRWYAIAGESYVARAFEYAHAADPDAKLFYNDYYNYHPVKQQAIYSMLRGLLDAGVPIHGVGLQCHISIQPSSDETHQAYHQTPENLSRAIQLYASLGLEVRISELDLSVYVPGTKYAPESCYTPETLTAAVQALQAARYREFFAMFRTHADVLSGVTFWGIADDNTWLSEFASGRQDFPLLFDVHHDPKPAYAAVMDF